MMRYLFFFIVIFVSACSSQPVAQKHYYLLRSDSPVETGMRQQAPQYSLQSVKVATYLDQSGLVLETAEGKIVIARQHQWAEPLRLSLPGFLAAEIGVALNQEVAIHDASSTATQINVSIDQLHGNAQGEVKMVAYWSAIAADGSRRAGQFSDVEDISSDGYEAMVRAEQDLLIRFSQKMGDALK
ncbi:MAG: ABC-type transport auxiliary lipoprotein family protein [Pseudomonadales bacterium]